ncbi:hypothetical protein [Pseudoroseicyclus aestuarii]|uniref:Uncharacterized protein n=1 Tax=Pseudoroseicyclus aestuarii TaxID=1795041 RepID=A0A318SMV1_9RHOB|nr:hypothetical protein [Pseudoroseicyclus aestuarii]PYE81421.1 hypothetical protein DFP88_106100 [Pseudoroseicyclus aestuarii]
MTGAADPAPTALAALCDDLDALAPQALVERLRAEVLRSGGTWHTDTSGLPALPIIALHGITLSDMSYAAAALRWRFAARAAAGGYAAAAPAAEPERRALQRAWALSVLQHLTPASDAVRDSAQALLDRMIHPGLQTIAPPAAVPGQTIAEAAAALSGAAAAETEEAA